MPIYKTGDYVGENLGLRPVTNYNFFLRVEAVFDCPCRAVRGFQKENEYEYIQEGGVNDYVHMRRKPISKPFTFQVERYVGVHRILDPLTLGTDLVLPLLLMVNRYSWDRYPYTVRTYVFTGCTVTAKEYGELSAEKSGLLVETTTIAYREMFAVDIGLGSNAEAVFGLEQQDVEEILDTDSEAEKRRKAKQRAYTKSNSRIKNTIVEETKAEMGLDAKKWNIQKPKEKRNAVQSPEELKKAQMVLGAKLWEFENPKANTSAKRNKKELSKKKMEAASLKKEIKAPNHSGNHDHTSKVWKIRSPKLNTKAKHPADEIIKSQMKVKAVKWPAKKSAVDVVSFLKTNKK